MKQKNEELQELPVAERVKSGTVTEYRLASDLRKLSTNLYQFLDKIFCGHF